MSWVALRTDLAFLHRGRRQLHIGKVTQTQNMSRGTLYTDKLSRPASTIILMFKKWAVMESFDLKSDTLFIAPLAHWDGQFCVQEIAKQLGELKW